MRQLISIVGRSALIVLAVSRSVLAQGSVSGQVSLREHPGEQTEDLADVIVWLEPVGGTRVRASPTNTTIQLQGRQFPPRVRVVTAASEVEFPNADSFSHNVFSKAPDGVFDTGVYSPMMLIAKVLDETPVAPHALHDGIPLALSAIVMKAMARTRDARPVSAKVLHDALEALG